MSSPITPLKEILENEDTRIIFLEAAQFIAGCKIQQNAIDGPMNDRRKDCKEKTGCDIKLLNAYATAIVNEDSEKRLLAGEDLVRVFSGQYLPKTQLQLPMVQEVEKINWSEKIWADGDPDRRVNVSTGDLNQRREGEECHPASIVGQLGDDVKEAAIRAKEKAETQFLLDKASRTPAQKRKDTIARKNAEIKVAADKIAADREAGQTGAQA